jgi:hypothetical protein
MSSEELLRLEYWAREQRRKKEMGQAIAKEDFILWAKNAFAWGLDKIEHAWRWLRIKLGLD